MKKRPQNSTVLTKCLKPKNQYSHWKTKLNAIGCSEVRVQLSFPEDWCALTCLGSVSIPTLKGLWKIGNDVLQKRKTLVQTHNFEKRPQHRTRMNWFCFCCFLESFLWWSHTFECDFVASRREFKMSYNCKAIWAPMMKFMVTQCWTFSCVKHEPISWKFLRRAYLRSWSCLARVKCFLITASWICACVFILVCTV